VAGENLDLGGFLPSCSIQPFGFADKTVGNEITDAFNRWLDAALAVSFRECGERWCSELGRTNKILPFTEPSELDP
jgi:hypothetical protein